MEGACSSSHLFIVDDEADSDLCVVGPFQALETLLSITLEVPGECIVLRCSVYLRHGSVKILGM